MRCTKSGARCLAPLVIVMFLLRVAGFAQCDHPVQGAGYTVCAPTGWRIDSYPGRTIICKPNDGRCRKNKDIYPYPGVLIVDINVADGLSYRGNWITPEEIRARAQRMGEPVPLVFEIPFKDASLKLQRSGWISRQLLDGNLWSEVYGLTVNGHRFMIRAFYNNERENIDQFRSDIIDILSSVRTTPVPKAK